MTALYVFLLLMSLICFVVEAVRGNRVNLDLVALGLAFAVAVPFLAELQKL